MATEEHEEEGEESFITSRRRSIQREEKTTALIRLEDRPTYRYGTEEDGFRYALGATLKNYLTIIGSCPTCEAHLSEPPPPNSFVFQRKYTDNSKLIFPSHSLMTYITAVDSIIQRTCKTHIHERKIINKIFNVVNENTTPPSSLRCDRHFDSLINVFLRKWIATSVTFILADKCNKINRMKMQQRKRKKIALQNIYLSHKRARFAQP